MKAETLCGPVLAATLNGVYQGIVLTILVGIVLRLLPRTNAATRHAVWFVSLLLVAGIVPAHYWLRHAVLTSADFAGVPAQVPALSPAPDAVVPLSLDQTEPLPFEEDLPGVEVEAGAEIPVGQPGPMGSVGSQMSEGQIVTSVPGSEETSGQPSPHLDPSGVRSGNWFDTRIFRPIAWRFATRAGLLFAEFLLGFWLVVAVFRLIMLAVRLGRLARLTDGSISPPPELQSLFERVRTEAGVKRRVSLKVSGFHRTPLLLGFFRPVVLIPADLAAQADPAEVKHVLAHELAHANRYDDWANLFQHLVQAVLFFHPSVWWINNKLSLEREIACDDHVLLRSGGPRLYALALANVAKRISQRAPMLAPGVWNSNSQLQQRISMILNTRRNSSPALAKARLAWIVTATVGVGLAALQIGPRVVFAESPATEPGPAVTATQTSAGSARTAALSGDAAGNSSSAAVSLVAQTDGPGVDPGPKFKPDGPKEESADIAVAPEPPEPPDVSSIDMAPPAVPHVARMSKPGKTPRNPENPDNDGDSSIEQRVRRLEKMVRELTEQQKVKHVHEFYLKDGADKQNFGMDQQEMDRMKASADRQAQRAAEQAQRATEQAKRATKDLQARIMQDQGQGEREGFQRQIEALRKARESLGQEMERLSHQIEKLEKEQQRGDKGRDKDRDKDQQRRSEVPSLKLQADIAPTVELGN
jgi:beta-lactamase regulating signal transducer with metallopeptidase domain